MEQQDRVIRHDKDEDPLFKMLKAVSEYRQSKLVVDIHKKKDGFLIINFYGASRFMTFWESVKYRLFGTRPVF